jgi:hypothetical protein
MVDREGRIVAPMVPADAGVRWAGAGWMPIFLDDASSRCERL